MAEASSGVIDPIHQESSPRIFSISPKSSHAWIEENIKLGHSYRYQIADDIVANAMELEPSVNWSKVVNSVVYTQDRKRYVGRTAIANRFARGVASTAFSMGWHMHSPEVVYTSMYSMIVPLSEKLDLLNEDINAIETGTHKFPTDEARQRKLNAEKQEAGELGAFNKRLRKTAEEYADLLLPDDPTYKKVLRTIIHAGHSSVASQRQEALYRLKKGDTAGAWEKLSKLKFKGFD